MQCFHVATTLAFHMLFYQSPALKQHLGGNFNKERETKGE
jgi:hypothetical protein